MVEQKNNLPGEAQEKKPAELLAEILATEKQILESTEFLHRYFKWQMIWNSVKWTILAIVVVLGFISLKAVLLSFQSYIDIFKNYTNQVQSLNNQSDVNSQTLGQ